MASVSSFCASVPLHVLRRSLNGLRRAAISRQTLSARWIHVTPVCMAIKQFKLADIGEGISEVEVLKWFVNPGDKVEEFDKICEVQSDKAVVDITSRYSGVIQGLHWKVGDMAAVGSALVDIETEADDNDTEESKVNDIIGSGKEELNDPHRLSQSSSKIEQPHINKNEDFVIKEAPKSLQPMGSFSVDPVLRPENDKFFDNPPSERSTYGEKTSFVATPAVRRLARDHSLDLSLVPASGKNGRVFKEDVLLYLSNVPFEKRQQMANQQKQQVDEKASTSTTSLNAQKTNSFTIGSPKLLKDNVVPVAGLQRIMVRSMEASLKVPHFNFMEEYLMEGLIEVRNQMKPLAAERGIKLTYMPIIMKATSLALTQFPQLNAHFLSEEMKLVHKASHNIGIAMDTPRGLLVPVVKDCQEKSIIDIASELANLHEKGLKNQLGEQELSGNTFTLSNIGAIGGTYASPIIPVPTVVIGALGRIQTLPRYEKIDGADLAASIYMAKVMNFSWAADHRVVDGATIARFSGLLQSYMVEPLRMLAYLV